jgi:hypothetical protein
MSVFDLALSIHASANTAQAGMPHLATVVPAKAGTQRNCIMPLR